MYLKTEKKKLFVHYSHSELTLGKKKNCKKNQKSFFIACELFTQICI